MWLPIFFSPSEASQAAGRRFLDRIRARTEDRDVPVSQATIAAHSAAARAGGADPPRSFDYVSESEVAPPSSFDYLNGLAAHSAAAGERGAAAPRSYDYLKGTP